MSANRVLVDDIGVRQLGALAPRAGQADRHEGARPGGRRARRRSASRRGQPGQAGTAAARPYGLAALPGIDPGRQLMQWRLAIGGVDEHDDQVVGVASSTRLSPGRCCAFRGSRQSPEHRLAGVQICPCSPSSRAGTARRWCRADAAHSRRRRAGQAAAVGADQQRRRRALVCDLESEQLAVEAQRFI